MNTAPTITGFNLAMEIACALPCEPVSVPMSLLCADFGLGAGKHVKQQLMSAGVDFRTRQTHNSRHVYIPRIQWKNVQKRCEAYWREVYGE